MTANLTLTPKKTVTTAMLVVIGTVALAYVTLQLPKPAADTGWRHEAAVAAPALPTAPAEMRARELDASAMTPAGEISIARGRN
jgi:hypothetical protein